MSKQQKRADLWNSSVRIGGLVRHRSGMEARTTSAACAYRDNVCVTLEGRAGLWPINELQAITAGEPIDPELRLGADLDVRRPESSA